MACRNTGRNAISLDDIDDDDSAQSETRKPILVIGSTGRLGSCIVKKLDERNIPCRCLVRPSSMSKLKYLGAGLLDIVEGDLANYEDVKAAVIGNDDGIGGCICVSGSFRKRRLRDFVRSRSSIREDSADTSHPYIVNHIGMQNLCRAMNELLKDNDNKNNKNSISSEDQEQIKLVKVSGVLLSLPKWHYIPLIGNLLYSSVIRWHKAGEKDITESGIPFTILRPGSFRDDDNDDDGGGCYSKSYDLIVSENGQLKPRLKVKKPVIGINALANLCIETLEPSVETDGKVLYPRWTKTKY